MGREIRTLEDVEPAYSPDQETFWETLTIPCTSLVAREDTLFAANDYAAALADALRAFIAE